MTAAALQRAVRAEEIGGTRAATEAATAPLRGAVVAGDGEPVVMLHASLSAKSQWTPLVERLAPRYTAIALDLVGYGDRPLPEHGRAHSIDDEVELVADSIDLFAAPRARVHLVGHSFGGLVALRYASLRPERVASLVLYEPVAFRILREDDPALAVVKCVAASATGLAAAGHLYEVAETVVDYWSGIGTYAAMPERTREAIARCSAKMPHDFAAAWAWHITDDDLRTVTMPVLLLAGRRSPVVTRNVMARLGAKLLDARVASFDCGHMGPVTDPDAINAAIAAFVGLHPGI